MPPLPGFSDNPLKTRSDVIKATKALLSPLHKHKSPQGARIKIPVETGTHFDETAAQLEGFARPLWAVGCLLSPTITDPDTTLATWPKGLITGTDPELEGVYWGDVADTDQRMVEMEIISFALLASPSAFFPSPSPSSTPRERAEIEQQRKNIITWLRSINGKAMPHTNWLWFRVLTNIALIKTCGVPFSELKEDIDLDLEILDGFEMGEGGGWSSDGTWGDGGRQADYYSGSFAIQFSQLLFVKYAADLDPRRAERYKKQAGRFARDFVRYFDAEGAAIPFGRSLTYRFAMGAFWSVVALAEVELPAPLDKLGVVKGLLLRHLRYWSQKQGIFHTDGTLNVGYAYPNAYMCEDYNSPQSPYWCLKTLVAISLPETHQFWTCEELPHPLLAPDNAVQVAAIKDPLQITCDSGNHHFLLSSGQFCLWPLKATEAKYGKFAYSSAFGFSVPTGLLIQQMAPDSTLALSNDGEEPWTVRWKSEDARFENLTFVRKDGKKENVPVLKSRWRPWKKVAVAVETTLIPPTNRWPDWHVRVHEIRRDYEDLNSLESEITAIEGGFAIFGRQKVNGLGLLSLNPRLAKAGSDEVSSEGVFESQDMALVISAAGASGIKDITTSTEDPGATPSQGLVLKPDANTNLMCQRTLIPILKKTIKFEGGSGRKGQFLVAGVFAISAKEGGACISGEELRSRWQNSPKVSMAENGPVLCD